jgi:hypothetical protein
MSQRSCAAVRRSLSAFHDGELPVGERIAVQNHLQECASCAAEVRDLAGLGEALRAEAIDRVARTSADLAGLPASVVSRLGAEQSESVAGRLGRLFEDWHVVWAVLGATGATVACIAVIVGLFHFATHARSDSLAAVFTALSSPGSNENPVSVDDRMLLPRTSGNEAFWAKFGDAETEEDLVLLMDVLVSKEGQVTGVKLLNADDEALRAESAARREAITALSDAILNARLQPARAITGVPLAVNVVWMHAHMTVRAKLPAELSRAPGRALSLLLSAEPSPLGNA